MKTSINFLLLNFTKLEKKIVLKEIIFYWIYKNAGVTLDWAYLENIFVKIEFIFLFGVN